MKEREAVIDKLHLQIKELGDIQIFKNADSITPNQPKKDEKVGQDEVESREKFEL